MIGHRQAFKVRKEQTAIAYMRLRPTSQGTPGSRVA